MESKSRRLRLSDPVASLNLIARPAFFKFAFALALMITMSSVVQAQTYQVGPGAAVKQAPAGQGKTSTSQGKTSAPQLGWGSNIQNARLARAAEMALQRGDYASAVDYAQRAAQAASNDAQLWFLLGYAARLARRYPLAANAYSRGLRLSPSTLDGISGLAQTYSATGRFADAERLLKQTLASDPARAGDAVLLGNLYMRSGDYTSALEWLQKAERLRPGARSELLLALSYQHLKQMDQANRYLAMAKRRAPQDPDVERALAEYYREMGKYSDAIAALKSIRNPIPDVIAELAYSYQLNGNQQQAAKLYGQAANALPRNLDLQLSAAQANVALGSIEPAEPYLLRAAALDANAYRLHAIRAQIAHLQDRDEEAAREYNEALSHLPANPPEGVLYRIQLHMDLMEIYRNIGDQSASGHQLDTARTEIAALDERGADRAPFLRLRARIELNDKQFQSALKDANEALSISPHDPDNLQLQGDTLMQLGRTDEAIAAYQQVLAIDPRSQFALTALGYAARAKGNDHDAERYFERLARDYPRLYVPYLGLGDMYTAHRDFKRAQAAYSKGYERAPKNSLVVAGGMTAAIEAQDLTLADTWLHRVSGRMGAAPKVLREEERFFRFKNDPRKSAAIGYQAIKILPDDRDVVVYLGYDLLQLGKYQELEALTSKYYQLLPKEPDIPLLAGYVDKHNGDLQKAFTDFSEVLKRDPTVVTAYVNRGYVLNDLRRPQEAANDFQIAIKSEPKNGVAHLGLAFADLNLQKSDAALREARLAQQDLGDSKPIHVIRATAYGREGLLKKAEGEYRAALKFTPDDGPLHLSLGQVLFSQRQYHEAIGELQTATRLIPGDAAVHAMLARSYANLQEREQAMREIQLAESEANRPPSSTGTTGPAESSIADIYVSTGQALNTLGDQKAAMERFSKALVAPHSNRVGVRFTIAQLMAQQGDSSGAVRQIALAQMEAQAGDTAAPSGEQYIQAAGVLGQLHEYNLAQSYLHRAKLAGAPDTSVRIASANNYLATGDTQRAAAELAAVSQVESTGLSYPYLLAQAQVYEQEHRTDRALSAFAQAANTAGDDSAAEEGLLQAGGNEGYRVNQHLSLLSDFSIQPIFEDSTIYVLDSKLDSLVAVPQTDFSELPPPRSSLQTEWTAAYHLHFGAMPTAGGFFQIRNARGNISVPATHSIVNRNTTDYTMNFGLSPTIHLGDNAITFNTGMQGTIRRDSLSPEQINQNLFRLFTYVTTSSFFNAVSLNGYVIRETGPFTNNNIYLHAITGAVNFRVGSPWGKTALVTGWGATDQRFSSVATENYFTSSYIGIERRFSDRLSVRAIAEDLRSWRMVGLRSGIAQALRPAGVVDFSPTRNWDVQATFAYSNTRGFHAYDMYQSGIAVSYTRPLSRSFNDETGEVHLKYPIRFSAGLQEETFPNFTQGQGQQFRPYISITLF